MKKKLLSLVRRHGAVCAALFSFLILNAVDQALKWNSEAVDVPQWLRLLNAIWVFTRNTVGFTFVSIAPMLILGRVGCWIVALLFPLLVCIESSVVFVDYTFHAVLSELWLDLLENTNVTETCNFISMIVTPGTIFVSLILLLVCIVSPFVLLRLGFPKYGKKGVGVGLCMLLPFLFCNIFFMNWHYGLAQTKYTNFFISTIANFKRTRGVRLACENRHLPQDLERPESERQPNIIIVLGESSTRSNWHLYGYSRKTTPRLDKLYAEHKVVPYWDVVGVHPDTVNALSLLLTDVTFDRLYEGSWTLAGVYKSLGYRCVQLSRQQSSSATKSSLYRIFNGCSERICLSGTEAPGTFDGSIVPQLEGVLKTAEPTAVFVHLLGMHYPVQNVIPPSERFFTDSIQGECLKGLSIHDRDRRNRYDDAILYEDKVLSEIIDVVEKCGSRPSVVFFVSDHGESPRSSQWRDFEDRDVYRVPVFFWFSKQYREFYPEVVSRVEQCSQKPLQQDELTIGLLEITGARSPMFEDKSFLRNGFHPRKPRLINKGRMAY